MKLHYLTIALVAARRAQAWQVRKLSERFDFLISDASPHDQPLCITATDGMRNFGNLKLMPCDFDTFPPEQLWNYEDGKFYNDLGSSNSKCMVANHGESVFDGVRMRLADCQDDLLSDFFYDGETIKLASDESFCITNRGSKANVGDSIHAKPCRDSPDFHWTHTEDDPSGGNLYAFVGDGGCMETKHGSTAPSTQVILGNCGAGSTWNVKDVNGIKYFRSGIDLKMCLQVGLGGTVQHGTKLRLEPCDSNKPLQQFVWEDEKPIRLASIDDFCVEWRGTTGNPRVDPIIMKDCDRTVWEGWSGDEV